MRPPPSSRQAKRLPARAMIPDARIVHRLPGRLRIKVDSHKRDVAFFSMLRNELRSCPGVLEVTANPVTASVLIQHAAAETKIVQFVTAHKLLNVRSGDAGPAGAQAQMTAGLQGFSRGVQGASGGVLDMDALIVMGLTGLAIQQAIEGNIMVPAASLLWYAYSAARMPPLERDRQSDGSADPASGAMNTPPGPGAEATAPAAGRVAQRRVKRKHQTPAPEASEGKEGRASEWRAASRTGGQPCPCSAAIRSMPSGGTAT